MGRGGAPKDRDGAERRCVATGRSGPKEPLIRFVLDPEGALTPDLAEKLPGRGVWLSADRDALALAARKNLFARGFKCAVPPTPDLAERIEDLLVRRLVEALALARKAGRAVAGFEKCREAAPFAVAIFQASDGATGGKAKLRRLAPEVPELNCLQSGELGLAFGRSSVIHAVLTSGGAATRAIREGRRLSGVRFGLASEARPSRAARSDPPEDEADPRSKRSRTTHRVDSVGGNEPELHDDRDGAASTKADE